MLKRTAKLLLILLVVTEGLHAQTTEVEDLIKSELQMTFPSIYFNNNSTNYAAMPYSSDSCFKYIAAHVNNFTGFVIWLDSSETEQITNKRIKKIKAELNKFTPTTHIKIESMAASQKIAQHTIAKASNETQRQYLLSLNAAFDVSTTRIAPEKKVKKKTHIDHPRVWCLNCWRRGRFTKEYRQLHVNKKQKKERKRLPHLVWTGWRTGFHWSTAGKPKTK